MLEKLHILDNHIKHGKRCILQDKINVNGMGKKIKRKKPVTN